MNSLTVILLHQLPGRIRLKLSHPPHNENRFYDGMKAHDGVVDISFNKISKSLLITHETGHLTVEEILLRTAIALSMEYGYQPVRVSLGNETEVMTDGAILAGLLLLAAGGVQIGGRTAGLLWLNRAAGLGVAAAVVEHGWHEAREHGYIHPEVLSVGYLAASWFRGNILRGATVTWFASFGRHLLQGPEKCIDVRPLQKNYDGDEPRTYQISLAPGQYPRSPLLSWAQSFLGILGLGGIGGGSSLLFKEIQNMAQAHDRVLEGLELQPNGIPLTFKQEL